MPTFSSPGVFVQEVASGVHPIEGVPTSIAAFVGWAARGATDKAILLTGLVDFEREFGELDPRSYLGYAVNHFFANGGQKAYVVRLVADGTDGTVAPVTASVAIAGLTFDSSAAPAASKVTISTGGSGGLTISARNPGRWGNDYTVQISPSAGDYSRFDLSAVRTDPATGAKNVDESFASVSLNPNDAHARYVVNVLNENSNILAAAMGSPPLALVNSPNPPATPLPAPGSGTVVLTGGDDGTVLNPAASPGSGKFEAALNLGGTQTGAHLLDDVPIFNLLAVPGEADPATLGKLQAFCVAKRAFLIADSEQTGTFATLQAGPDNQMTGANAINSALYFPWLNALDPQQNKTRAFPPSGFMAGVYAATDIARGVWKAPAGIGATLGGTTGPAVSLTDSQMGVLNVGAVNCIRSLPQGTVAWGARTLRGADAAGSEWKYVPVRRLGLYIEESLYRGTQWVVFEPNGEQLWSQIRLNVGAFMHGLFQQGALQGSTPKQAYFVKCDAGNNPRSSIDNGIVNILVGFAPLYPAEFVIIRISQQAGAEAQFLMHQASHEGLPDVDANAVATEDPKAADPGRGPDATAAVFHPPADEHLEKPVQTVSISLQKLE